MKILSHESMSRWYTLSFDEKRQGILISVDREFAESVIVPADSPIVYYNSKKLDADGLFDRFSPSMDEEFGWNGSLKKQWIIFLLFQNMRLLLIDRAWIVLERVKMNLKKVVIIVMATKWK